MGGQLCLKMIAWMAIESIYHLNFLNDITKIFNKYKRSKYFKILCIHHPDISIIKSFQHLLHLSFSFLFCFFLKYFNTNRRYPVHSIHHSLISILKIVNFLTTMPLLFSTVVTIILFYNLFGVFHLPCSFITAATTFSSLTFYWIKKFFFIFFLLFYSFDNFSFYFYIYYP